MAEKSVEKEVSNGIAVVKSLKKETVVFLALTFGLTFLLNFVMWLNYELIAERMELFSLALQFQMLLPAFSAIVLNLFVSKSKPFSRKPRILFYYFLILTALYALTFALWLINPIDIASIQIGSTENLGLTVLMGLLSLVTTLLTFGWIGLIFFWNLKSDSRKELKAAKLSFGKPSYYLLFSLFFFGYFLLSTILNWGFNLGSPPAIRDKPEFTHYAKDEGVDVIGWKPIDGRAGQLILLTQCTIEKKWSDSTQKIDLDTWANIVNFTTKPQKALAFPYVCHSQWKTLSTKGGILLDRLRLVSLFPMVSTLYLRKKITNWSTLQIGCLNWFD